MKYAHLVQYVMSTPWELHPTKLLELLSVLAFRAAGGEFTPQEIAARIGAPQPATGQSRGAVAILPVYGVLSHRMGSLEESSGGMSTEQIGRMFDAAQADSSIGTIVLDVNSPGGTVPGVQELAAKIRAAKGQKPVIAVANDLMASAAYHIASQADEIVGIPSSRVGSIGVYAAHEDLSKALEAEGITVTLLSAGKYKTEGNAFEPLSEEAKAFLQARIDVAYQQFVSDVAVGRGVTAAAVSGGFGQGRALGAPEALAAGLIDRIATFEDVLRPLVPGSDASIDMRRRRLALI